MIVFETCQMTIVEVNKRFYAWINGGKEVEFESEEAAIEFAWNY